MSAVTTFCIQLLTAEAKRHFANNTFLGWHCETSVVTWSSLPDLVESHLPGRKIESAGDCIMLLVFQTRGHKTRMTGDGIVDESFHTVHITLPLYDCLEPSSRPKME
jgi:hypothetical protein